MIRQAAVVLVTMAMAGIVHAGCLPSAVVVHINGVATTQDEANDNKAALEKSLTSRGIVTPVELAYNPTQGQMWDVIQAALQKLSESPSSLPSSVVQMVVGGILKISLLPETIAGPIKDAVNSGLLAINNLMVFDAYEPDDFNQVLARVDAMAAANKEVLLVPHSQGNFYANALYEPISQKAAVRIVGVATPTGYTAGSGDYLTSASDEVVNRVRAAIPVRPANHTISQVEEPGAKDGERGHSFLDVYLNRSREGEPVLVNKIQVALSGLSTYTPGSFEVTVTWPPEAQLALHVAEPCGIVSPQQPVCYGQLDTAAAAQGCVSYRLDAVTQAGQYIPQLHYRSGTQTVPAFVTVKAPDGRFATTLTVAPPLSPYGSPPALIAAMNVLNLPGLPATIKTTMLQ